jgi:hypothetical protein
LSDLTELAKEDAAIVTSKGPPSVAARDGSGSDRDWASLANNSRFMALIEASRRFYCEKGGIELAWRMSAGRLG